MYSEENAPYDDIVKVECTPYGMVHWALQYSDRVEVVEPQEVREAVIEKVRNLNEKYGIKCVWNEPVEEVVGKEVSNGKRRERYRIQRHREAL